MPHIVIGIGLKRGRDTVKWKVVLEMVLAWIVTLPVSALIALLAFWVLAKITIVWPGLLLIF